MRYLEIPGIYQDFYGYMLGKKIYISDRLKRQLGREEWRRLLRRYVGSFTTDRRKGIPIDTLYCEILELFPWIFREEVTAEEDQIYTVFDIYDAARQEQTNNHTRYKEETEMKVLSIINLKGGVAKTISSVNMAYILVAAHGFKVLLIDNDKQGNASKILNRHSYERKGTADIMTERNLNMAEIIQHTDYEGLDIVTANMNLLKNNLEVLLDQQRPQQIRFKKALEQVKDQYDFCIIDNAPDINISTINALVASDDVMVPITIDDFAIDGLAELKEQIDNTREDLNPVLNFRGCFVTQFDRQNEADWQGEEYLKSLDYPIFKTHIRRTPKMKPSTFAREPIMLYSSRCSATQDYKSLVAEYLEM